MSRVRFALAALAVGALGPVAHAQLSNDALGAFNTAVQSGDIDAIISASTALMDNAIANPSDPNATVAAYEAALKLCERQACETALRGAEFVLTQPDTGDHPVMTDRALLESFAAFSTSVNRSSRSGLDEALQNVRDRDPNHLSIRASVALYTEHLTNGSWRDAWRVATASAEHLYPVRNVVSEAYFDARQQSAIAYFYSEQTRESHEALARWNAETRQTVARILDAGYTSPEWLEKVYWQSEAYMTLAERWFYSNDIDNSFADSEASRRQQQPLTEGQLDLINAEYPLPNSEGLLFHPRTDGELRRCRGELINEPELRYPTIARGWDGVAVVVARLWFDDDGSVSDQELLASIPPSSLFEERSLETMQDWHFELADDEDRSECSVSAYPFYYQVAFFLRRD